MQPELTLRADPGQWFEYEAFYRSDSRTDHQAMLKAGPRGLSAIAGLPERIETRIAGRLDVTVLSAAGGRVRLAMAMREPTVRLIADGQENQVRVALIREGLTRRWFVLADRLGRIRNARFPHEDPMARAFARMVTASWQFSLPPQAGTREWSQDECDPAGIHEVAYRLLATTGGNRVISMEKRKVQYRREPESVAERKVVAVRSHSKIVVDRARGMLHEVAGREEQRIEVAGRKVSETSARWGFNLLRLRPAPTAAVARMTAEARFGEPPRNWAASSESDEDVVIHRRELGNETLATLTASLARAEKVDGAKQVEDAIGRLVPKIKALLFLQPQTSQRLGRLLWEASPQGPTVQAVGLALARIGHQPAQAALAEAVRRRRSQWPAMQVLLPYLAESARPSPATVSLLEELSFSAERPSITDTAALNLGRVAWRLLRSEPERARRIVIRLGETLARLPEGRKEARLLSLGNIGAAEILPVVTPYLRHASKHLRGAAALALRGVPLPPVDALLAGILAQDPEFEVRLAAAEALAQREPVRSTLSAQLVRFGQDDSLQVRMQLLRNIWAARHRFPAALELVKQAARRDGTKEIRDLAEQLLLSE